MIGSEAVWPVHRLLLSFMHKLSSSLAYEVGIEQMPAPDGVFHFQLFIKPNVLLAVLPEMPLKRQNICQCSTTL